MTSNTTQNPNLPASEKKGVAPWGFLILVLIFLFTIPAATWRKIDQSEVLFHLKTGQVILRTDQVPNRDIFSATSSVGIWVYFEWLWAMALGYVWQICDNLHIREWIGLNAVSALLTFLTAWLIFWRCKRHAARSFESAILTLATVIILLPMMQASPEGAILPVFLISLLIMEATKRRWPMIAFPAIAALWANLHVSAPLVCMAPLARALFPGEASKNKPSTISRFFCILVLAACLIGLLVTPHSLRIIPAWFHTISVNFQSIPSILNEALTQAGAVERLIALLVFLILSASARSLAKWQWAWLIFACISTIALSVSAINLTLVFLTAPAAAGLSHLLTKTWHGSTSIRMLAASALSLTPIFLMAMTIFAIRLSPADWGSGVRANVFPETAAGRLSAIPLRATILNDANDADYLLWRLWPDWKISIDHRPGFYDREFMDQYEAVWSGAPGWKNQLAFWRVHAILGRHELLNRHPDHNLFHELADSEEWVPVYWDSGYILYINKDVELSNSNLASFRVLKPGLPWNRMESRLSNPLEWQELAADLRRVLLDDPANMEAVEFLKRTEAQLTH